MGCVQYITDDKEHAHARILTTAVQGFDSMSGFFVGSGFVFIRCSV